MPQTPNGCYSSPLRTNKNGYLKLDGPEAVSDDSLVRQLEFELTSTREELEGTIEEMQSVNEELQSSNEELETSGEELQSLNEELTTSNVQLNEKVGELEQANNDKSNLIGSIDHPTVCLDMDFRIRWFTPASARLWSLLPGDIGRPFTDIAPQFDDPDLLRMLSKCCERHSRRTRRYRVRRINGGCAGSCPTLRRTGRPKGWSSPLRTYQRWCRPPRRSDDWPRC